ncbi:MAG: alpha/beta hydrolase [Pirellulaceae bacterium]
MNPSITPPSVLDSSAISGRYLFPQPRRLDNPWVVSTGHVELACFRRIVTPEGYTMVHFHGNGEAVADYVPDIADEFAALGLNCLFVEYRQYGGSSGQAQLVAMLVDGEAVLRAAGLAPQNTIVFGRSIGSLYAIELAHRLPDVAGLILESGIADPAERFLAYADLAAADLDEHGVRAEVGRYFDHRSKLAGYQGPLLVLHAERDRLIDISHAERNLAWAGSRQKRLVRFPYGDHNSILAWNRAAYFAEVAAFVQGLGGR